MDDQTFRLLMSKLDAMHDDLRQQQVTVAEHIAEDQKQWSEVHFIKRAFQATWAGFGMLCAYFGIKH